MEYKEWRDYVIVEFDIISKNYNKKIYETIAVNKETGDMDFIQLTVREVLNKVEGTNLELPMRRAIMRVVYANAKLDREIRKVMDVYYEV